METDLQDLCIDAARFQESFEALAAMGATPRGGGLRVLPSGVHPRKE